jgi:hypothetical protein
MMRESAARQSLCLMLNRIEKKEKAAGSNIRSCCFVFSTV